MLPCSYCPPSFKLYFRQLDAETRRGVLRRHERRARIHQFQSAAATVQRIDEYAFPVGVYAYALDLWLGNLSDFHVDAPKNPEPTEPAR